MVLPNCEGGWECSQTAPRRKRKQAWMNLEHSLRYTVEGSAKLELEST